MKSLIRFALTVGVALGLGICYEQKAEAGFTAYKVSAGDYGNQNFDGILGMDFIVNEAIKITDLGVFDDASNGLVSALTTELWSRNDKGTPNNFYDDIGITKLASMNFSPNEPGQLDGGSRFKKLDNPLVIRPGNYTIVAYGYGRGENNGNAWGGGWGTTNNGGGLISFVGLSRYGHIWSGDVFGQSIGSRPDWGAENRYAAGTFKYEAASVHEPSSILGVLGLSIFATTSILKNNKKLEV
ncbi:hypothetical protein RIVM261_032660 [Rivularia sp. IAM M-261]|nr:hypothetical protein RIVM261_032660 [Rivularia sp. IAM M-261]